MRLGMDLDKYWVFANWSIHLNLAGDMSHKDMSVPQKAVDHSLELLGVGIEGKT
jgi:hypothetical protein